MTAPKRRNGQFVKNIVRGCESKRRYADEYAARAAGQLQSEREGIPFFIYGCRLCRGFHLTTKKNNVAWRNASYMYTNGYRPRR